MNKNYILKLFIVLTLLLSLVGCGPKKTKIGMLGDFSKESIEIVNKVLNTNNETDSDFSKKQKYIEFDNVNTLLMALKSGKIDYIIVDETTARYYTKRQTGLTYEVKDPNQIIKYSLCLKDDKKELCDQISSVISQLASERFLEIININFIDNVVNGVDPGPLSLVHFDGAPTYKIAITGDLPPMDYINQDGQPAGYNVALLNEISKRLAINFELVNIESGAKTNAINSGKVDCVFWVRGYNDDVVDAPKGTLFTIPYYQSPIANLTIKK